MEREQTETIVYTIRTKGKKFNIKMSGNRISNQRKDRVITNLYSFCNIFIHIRFNFLRILYRKTKGMHFYVHSLCFLTD